VCALTEVICDNTKDAFCEELKPKFNQFMKYHMKILLGDFNEKVGTEEIFKPTTVVYMKLVLILGVTTLPYQNIY
jgi:hypothetical protein